MTKPTQSRGRKPGPPVDVAAPDRLLPRICDDPLAHAFDSRAPLMPWHERRPIPAAEVASVWQALAAEPAASGKRLAYVHVPYCANHCLFCGFYRNKYRREDSPRYVQAVIDELHREADTSQIGNAPIHALYLGGGTPTALETHDLVRLIETLRSELPLAPDCELTLEGRILHFDEEKVDACLDSGINRISIGVQSFDTRVRRQQGRRASGEQAARFIAGLIARDRAAVVIDLICGLPGQNETVWRRDLQTSLELAPDGLDVYCLAMFPGTPLHRAVSNGRVAPPARLSEQGRMYAMAGERFGEAGWRQISNSHWARTTRERNLYNLLVKAGAATLAYGSGAGGSLGDYSYGVDGDLQAYLAAVREGRKPLAGMFKADALRPLRDLVAAGLETGRLDLDRLRQASIDTTAVLPELQSLADVWEQAGLARRQGHVVSLTTAGRFWSTNLITGMSHRLSQKSQAADPG